jgi:endonuclease/exonuclease/phosphatase family metal-dependent hydrolase
MSPSKAFFLDAGPPQGQIRFASYNIHKGVLGLRSKRLTIYQVKEKLHALNADIIFLQEVQGKHEGHASRFDNWPSAPQHEFLAQREVSKLLPDNEQLHTHYHSAYGLNAFYSKGHHGNALLSKYPIRWRANKDVSDHALEQRGILHCVLDMPFGELHAFVVHLGLFSRGRLRQVERLIAHVVHAVPEGAPLVIAGDFNDWQGALSKRIENQLGVEEAFAAKRSFRAAGALSFPAFKPMLSLDRLYQRGFHIAQAQVLSGVHWSKVSDHAPLLVDMQYADL